MDDDFTLARQLGVASNPAAAAKTCRRLGPRSEEPQADWHGLVSPYRNERKTTLDAVLGQLRSRKNEILHRASLAYIPWLRYSIFLIGRLCFCRLPPSLNPGSRSGAGRKQCTTPYKAAARNWNMWPKGGHIVDFKSIPRSGSSLLRHAENSSGDSVKSVASGGFASWFDRHSRSDRQDRQFSQVGSSRKTNPETKGEKI